MSENVPTVDMHLATESPGDRRTRIAAYILLAAGSGISAALGTAEALTDRPLDKSQVATFGLTATGCAATAIWMKFKTRQYREPTKVQAVGR